MTDVDDARALLRFPFEHRGSWGLIDGNARVLTPPSYAVVNDYSDDLALVGVAIDKHRREWGYVDREGRVAIKPAFTAAAPFACGLASCSPYIANKGTRRGYLGPDGQWAIDPIFSGIYPANFDGDHATAIRPARRQELIGIIDRSGTFVVEPTWLETTGLCDETAVVKDGRKWGAVNIRGETTIAFKWVELGKLSEGLVAARRGKKWGYLTSSGDVAIALRFLAAKEFRAGYAAVKLAGGWGLIDREGNTVLEPKWTAVAAWASGLVAVRAGDLWGYVDLKDRVVIEPQFRSVTAFQGEVACVDGARLIDQTGTVIAELGELQVKDAKKAAAAARRLLPQDKPRNPKMFRFYSDRPNDWDYPHVYRLKFIEKPQAKFRAELAEVVRTTGADGPAYCRRWQWNGRWARVELLERQVDEDGSVQADRFFARATELFRALHEAWPLEELVLTTAIESDGILDGVARRIQKEPSRPPKGAWQADPAFDEAAALDL